MHSYINTSFFYLSDLSLLPSMRLDACIHYGLKIKGKKKQKKKKTEKKDNSEKKMRRTQNSIYYNVC